MWGVVINGIQAAGLEHKGIRDAPWTGATVGLLIAYTAGMFYPIYTPRNLYRASATQLLYSDVHSVHRGPSYLPPCVVSVLQSVLVIE